MTPFVNFQALSEKFSIMDRFQNISRPWLVCVFLTSIILVPYWQVRNHEFVHLDDNIYVYDNPHLRDGLTWKEIGWAFTAELLFDSPHADYWQPVTFFSRLLDVQFFGFNPSWHHLVNVGFHILNTLLLFHVLRRMTTAGLPPTTAGGWQARGGEWQTGSLERSAVVAALFAVHPLNVEAVAWVTARKDMLGGFFWMLTLWAYCRYVEFSRREVRSLPAIVPLSGTKAGERAKKWGSYGLVVLMFALGLMAKPMCVTLPFVLLLLDYWPLGRMQNESACRATGPVASRKEWQAGRLPYNSRKQSVERLIKHRAFCLFLEKCPLFALSLLSMLVTLRFQSDHLDHGSWLNAAVNILVSYTTYLRKVFFPTPLAVWYPPPTCGYSPLLVIGSALFLAALFAWAFHFRKNRPWLLVGGLWFAGALTPVIGLRDITGADRFTYLPLIGIFIMIAWSIPNLAAVPSWQRRGLQITLGIAAVALMTGSWFQARYWRNSVTLFEHAILVTHNNWLAHNNLGVALLEKHACREAVPHFREALRINPNFEKTRCNMGNALNEMGRPDEALRQYQEAVRLKPDYADAHYNIGNILSARGNILEAVARYNRALQFAPTMEKAHNNLGISLARLDRLDEALQHYKEAVRIKPDYAEAWFNMGNALKTQGKFADAIGSYTEAIRLMPNLEKAHNNLGISLSHLGRFGEALQQYHQALRIKPHDEDACSNMGNALNRMGRLEEALKAYNRALKINPNAVHVHYNMGMTLSELGRRDEAAGHFNSAVRLQPDFKAAQLAMKNLRRKK